MGRIEKLHRLGDGKGNSGASSVKGLEYLIRGREVIDFIDSVDRIVRVYNPLMREDKKWYRTLPVEANIGGNMVKINLLGEYADGQIVRGLVHVKGKINEKRINAYRGLKIDDIPDKKTMKRRMRLLKSVIRLFENEQEAPAGNS